MLNYQRVNLVDGAITCAIIILKNDGLRQWQGLSHYGKKTSHVPNHQPVNDLFTIHDKRFRKEEQQKKDKKRLMF